MTIIVKLNHAEVRRALREYAARKSGVNLDRIWPTFKLDSSRHVRTMSEPVNEVTFTGTIN